MHGYKKNGRYQKKQRFQNGKLDHESEPRTYFSYMDRTAKGSDNIIDKDILESSAARHMTIFVAQLTKVRGTEGSMLIGNGKKV